MCVRVLYRLSFVKDDSIPFHLCKLAVVAHDKRVTRHHYIGFCRRLLEATPDMAHVSLMDIDAQRRRKLRKLMPPVRQQCQRSNNKNSPHLTPDPN